MASCTCPQLGTDKIEKKHKSELKMRLTIIRVNWEIFYWPADDDGSIPALTSETDLHHSKPL